MARGFIPAAGEASPTKGHGGGPLADAWVQETDTHVVCVCVPLATATARGQGHGQAGSRDHGRRAGGAQTIRTGSSVVGRAGEGQIRQCIAPQAFITASLAAASAWKQQRGKSNRIRCGGLAGRPCVRAPELHQSVWGPLHRVVMYSTGAVMEGVGVTMSSTFLGQARKWQARTNLAVERVWTRIIWSVSFTIKICHAKYLISHNFDLVFNWLQKISNFSHLVCQI